MQSAKFTQIAALHRCKIPQNLQNSVEVPYYFGFWLG